MRTYINYTDSKISKNNSLDDAYRQFLINVLFNCDDEETTERWELYDYIMLELKFNGYLNYIKEIKYRLTDGENPNYVILDIMNRDGEVSGFLWPVKRRIESFYDTDILKKLGLY